MAAPTGAVRGVSRSSVPGLRKSELPSGLASVANIGFEVKNMQTTPSWPVFRLPIVVGGQDMHKESVGFFWYV